MSLRNIITEPLADTGFALDQLNKNYVIDKLNKVASAFHKTNNLKWSCREQYTTLDPTVDMIAFPWYVDKLWGSRNADNGTKVNMNDMFPRYKSVPWKSILQSWRVLQKQALKRNLVDATKLWVHLKQASTVAVTIYLVIATEKTGRVTEEVVFAVGEIAKETTNIVSEVESISKNIITNTDVFVSTAEDPDDEDAIVSELPNHQMVAQYLKVQVNDWYIVPEQAPLFEICYKQTYIPFVNDTDQFVCTDIYDVALQTMLVGELMMVDAKSRKDGLATLRAGIDLGLQISSAEEDEEISRFECERPAGTVIHEQYPISRYKYPLDRVYLNNLGGGN